MSPAGADPARRAQPGGIPAGRFRRGHLLDRTLLRRQGQGHGHRPAQRRRERARHGDPRHHQGAADRLRQGRRRQVLDLGEPRHGAGHRGDDRRAARRRHLGLLGAPHAGPHRPPRGSRDRTQDPAADPGGRRGHAEGRLDGPAGGRRADGADVARPHPEPGGAPLPGGRAVGTHGLPGGGHAAGHRRRADGDRQAAAPSRDDHRHDPLAQRPERGGARRQHGPQQLPAHRRRHREHDRLRGSRRDAPRALRRGRRRGAGRRDRGATAGQGTDRPAGLARQRQRRAVRGGHRTGRRGRPGHRQAARRRVGAGGRTGRLQRACWPGRPSACNDALRELPLQRRATGLPPDAARLGGERVPQVGGPRPRSRRRGVPPRTLGSHVGGRIPRHRHRSRLRRPGRDGDGSGAAVPGSWVGRSPG